MTRMQSSEFVGKSFQSQIIGIVALTIICSFAKTGTEFALTLGREGFAPISFAIVAVFSLSALVLIYLPGILIAQAIGGGRDGQGALLAKGFAYSILVLSLLSSALSASFSFGFPGAGFALLLGLLSALALWACRARGCAPQIPQDRALDALTMALVPMAVLAIMFPKFAFESFNGDGAHVFQSMRNFIASGNPFWPDAAGAMSSYPALSTMLEVLAGSWWIRLFGESELAARLPLLGGLALLTGIVLDLARSGQNSLKSYQVALIGLALVLYAATYGWQASYNPYFADIALPLAREPLVMIAFLGFVIGMAKREYGTTFAFACLSYMAIPSAPVFMGLLLIAFALVWRPFSLPHLLISGVQIVVVFALGMALPIILAKAGIIGSSNEFGAGNLLRRLRFVTPFEVERFIYWIVPCGILPALGLLAWTRHDRLSQALVLTALGYFGFFYLQAYRVLPHHFAPVPILALIVFWRLQTHTRAEAAAKNWGALVGIVAGFILAAPAHWPPHTYTEEFAERIAFKDSRYDEMAYFEFGISHDLLLMAFPMLYSDDGASQRYLGSPLAWYTHASTAASSDVTPDYTIHPAPASAEEHVIAEKDGYVLVVRDLEIYEADLARPGPLRNINELFYVPRHVIFGQGTRSGPRPVWDLAKIAGLR